MNDLIRPALYKAKHRIVPALRQAVNLENHWNLWGQFVSQKMNF